VHDKLKAKDDVPALAPPASAPKPTRRSSSRCSRDADVVVIAIETLDHRIVVERVKQALPKARIVVVSFRLAVPRVALAARRRLRLRLRLARRIRARRRERDDRRAPRRRGSCR